MTSISQEVYDDLPEHIRRTVDVEKNHDNISFDIDHESLTDRTLQAVLESAKKVGDLYIVETMSVIAEARAGRFRQIKNRNAMPEAILAYLAHDAIDGWVYVDTKWGTPIPLALTSLDFGFGG